MLTCRVQICWTGTVWTRLLLFLPGLRPRGLRPPPRPDLPRLSLLPPPLHPSQPPQRWTCSGPICSEGVTLTCRPRPPPLWPPRPPPLTPSQTPVRRMWTMRSCRRPLQNSLSRGWRMAAMAGRRSHCPHHRRSQRMTQHQLCRWMQHPHAPNPPPCRISSPPQSPLRPPPPHRKSCPLPKLPALSLPLTLHRRRRRPLIYSEVYHTRAHSFLLHVVIVFSSSSSSSSSSSACFAWLLSLSLSLTITQLVLVVVTS